MPKVTIYDRVFPDSPYPIVATDHYAGGYQHVMSGAPSHLYLIATGAGIIWSLKVKTSLL